MYRCPICHSSLNKIQNSFKCANNHNFDISKHGHVNLYRSTSQNHGDNNQLVLARTAFLNKGYYKPLRDKMLSIIQDLKPVTIADLGSGEGYYTNSYQDYTVYGFDLSKKAIETASKHNKSSTINYAVASIFNLPLFDHSIDLATIIFAPTPLEELKRILKKEGYLIEVSPNINHLYELKDCLYDQVILNNPSTHQEFKLINSYDLTYKIDVCHEDLLNLFLMTPYSYKSSKEAYTKLNNLDKLSITISFLIQIYQIN